MIGDDTCQTECNSAACAWDSLDCGCAPSCDQPDYGTCKSSCLVFSCNYDSMPGKTACASEALKLASRTIQAFLKTTEASYSYQTFCGSSSPSCTSALWEQSYSSCVPECQSSSSCLYSFGNCDNDCSAFPGCQQCTPLLCLKCQTGKFSFYLECVETCPLTFQPSTVDGYTCVPQPSSSQPDIYYVSTQKEGRNLGTAEDPFWSLYSALAAAHGAFVRIYLLSGVHQISNRYSNAYLRQLSRNSMFLLYTYPSLNIVIRPLYCSEATHPQCVSDSYVTLQVDNSNPVLLHLQGEIALEGIRFDGNTSLMPGCTTALCTYCPLVSTSGNGYKDDRQSPISAGTFAPKALCAVFHNDSFITLEANTALYLDNVQFDGFRQEFRSLIAFSDATLSLRNVTFSNISTLKAAISQAKSTLISSIQLFNISVSLLNNGFEYSPTATFSGFLDLQNALKISVKDSNFTFNLLSLSESLLLMRNFTTLELINCRFEYNLGIAVTVASAVALPLDLDENNHLKYFYLPHISVIDCWFRGNSGNSIVSIGLNGDILNVEIRKCQFESNLSLLSGLITIQSANLLSEKEISGANYAVISGNSRVKVYFPSNWVNITHLSFTGCSVYGFGLLSLSNMANLRLEFLTITASGDTSAGQNYNDLTLKSIIAQENTYMNKTVSGISLLQCSALVYLSDVAGLILQDTTLVGNVCNGGAAGIIGLRVGNEVRITGLKVTNTASVSQQYGAALDLSLLATAFLSQLTIVSNSNSASKSNGVIKLTTSASPASIVNSVFQGNLIPTGGALQCIGSCIVADSLFDGNIGRGATAAGLVYSPLPIALQFSVLRVVFKNHFSVVGAALTIANDNAVPAKIALTILSSLFQDNTSERQGSCIHITASVTLSDSSLIQYSTFRNNTAPQACIFNNFLSGILTVDECVFVENRSPGYAVIYSANPASTATVASRVILQSSLFEKNSGAMCIYFINMDARSEGESRNITYRYNNCRGIVLMWTSWVESNSTFHNNTTPHHSPGIDISLFSTCFITNTVFRDNSSPTYVGGLYVTGASIAFIRNVTFLRNKAEVRGGALYLDQDAVMDMRNCRFIDNSANDGSALYLFSGGMDFSSDIYDCEFVYNTATTGTIIAIETNVTFTRCRITTNSAQEYPGVSAFLAELRFIDTNFSDHKAAKGAFIGVPASSVISLHNCRLETAEVTDRGAGIYATSTHIEVTDSVFVNLKANLGTAIAAYTSSTVVVRNCLFLDIDSGLRGGVIVISESSLSLSNSVFANFVNGAIVSQSSSLAIQSASFTNGTSAQGTAVFCSKCPEVSIAASTCRNLTAEIAPCFSLSAASDIQSFSIASCIIESNKGQSRGAVLIDSALLSISNSLFSDNSAEKSNGEGGGLSLLCSAAYCNVSISDTVFVRNRAGRNGGAIAWSRFKPLLANVVFRENSALYGSNVSSFPIKIAPVSSAFLVPDVPSGQPATTNISIGLYDHYDNIVTSDSSSLADLFPLSSENTTVAGVTRETAQSGIFHFTAYEITHEPGSTTQVKVITTGIDMTKSEVGVNISSELVLNVSMRLCLPGESQLTNRCYPCPEEKYSLEPTDACKECPKGAVCLGRASMVPEPGYWRSMEDTDVFWPCPNEKACLGSNTTGKLEPTGICAPGYYGNMCNGCLGGYFRSSRNICSECPDPALSLFKTVCVGLLALLFIMFVIKMSLISAHRTSSQFSIYMKIFVNYLQLVTVTAAFDLAWPVDVSTMLSAQESAGSISEQIFALDCYGSSEDSQRQTVFLKLIIVSCIPLFILVISALFWLLIAWCRSRWDYLKSQLVNSLAVTFFIAHPSIFKVAIDSLNCKEIDHNEFWMSSYLNIRCWDDFHSRYALAAGLPSIMLWGILTPLGALAILVKLRSKLDTLAVRIRLGFLYTGYKSEKFYWEFVILYRKVLLIIFAVFLTNISIALQALLALLTLVIAFILQMKRSPYLTPDLNNLELRAILVGALTIYCGLFFLTGHVNLASHIALFITIILANAYFLFYWLLKTCRAGLQLIFKGFSTVRGIFQRRHESTHPIDTSKEGASPSQGGLKWGSTQYVDRSVEEWPFGVARVPANSMVDGLRDSSSNQSQGEQAIGIN